MPCGVELGKLSSVSSTHVSNTIHLTHTIFLHFVEFKIQCRKTNERDETELTSCLIMHHTSKVLDTKLGFIAVFRRDVVGVELVL